MTGVKTNWQAIILALATASATAAWYVTARNYTGFVGSIIMVAFTICCGLSTLLYIGRAIGNNTVSSNVILSSLAAFGTVLAAVFGGWQFLTDVSGTGHDFDYAMGWGVATLVVLWLGYSEIKQAATVVQQIADSAADV